jgi:DNA replication protein DnaC
MDSEFNYVTKANMSDTKSAAEALEPFNEQLERLSKGFPMTPERAAEIKEQQGKAALQAKRSSISAIRSSWNAPKRHATRAEFGAGRWLEQLCSVKTMLGKGGGLIIALVGGRGNGKTQMAVELMKWYTEDLKSATFTTAVEFFMAIKATYKAQSLTGEVEIMERFRKPKLLVIDEIGKRGQTEWENTLLFELLNSRYNDMLDSVLIDNRSKEEFIDMIGPSLASRMNEGGGIIECTWPSFRA